MSDNENIVVGQKFIENIECENCHTKSSPQLESVAGRGKGWKCSVCGRWNWISAIENGPLCFHGNIEENIPGYLEIPRGYYPSGIGPGGFSPQTLYASALAYQSGYIHDMEIKSWVVLWLLDHMDWDNSKRKLEIALQTMNRDIRNLYYGNLEVEGIELDNEHKHTPPENYLGRQPIKHELNASESPNHSMGSGLDDEV